MSLVCNRDIQIYGENLDNRKGYLYHMLFAHFNNY
jgi:hypothetical protein